MRTISETLARFDALSLPWQLAIMAGLVVGIVVVLAAGHRGMLAAARGLALPPSPSPGRR